MVTVGSSSSETFHTRSGSEVTASSYLAVDMRGTWWGGARNAPVGVTNRDSKARVDDAEESLILLLQIILCNSGETFEISNRISQESDDFVDCSQMLFLVGVLNELLSVEILVVWIKCVLILTSSHLYSL